MAGRLTPHHVKIGFDVFDHGIIKRRVREGGSEDEAAWSVGHPILFPNILRVNWTFQIRVPRLRFECDQRFVIVFAVVVRIRNEFVKQIVQRLGAKVGNDDIGRKFFNGTGKSVAQTRDQATLFRLNRSQRSIG